MVWMLRSFSITRQQAIAMIRRPVFGDVVAFIIEERQRDRR